ncbi:MAG: isochorismatase family protein [Chloroflexota bacterium]|nr:isochorismatase family protein [Chloroflexota bacterium]
MTVRHVWDDVIDEDTRAIYAAYDRDRWIGKRPVVLAIDLYQLVFEGGPRPVRDLVERYPSSCGVEAWNAVAPTQALFAVARERDVPVIYTTGETRPDARHTVHATRRGGRRDAVRDYAFQTELAPLEGDLVVRKQRASAFFGTPLVAHLVEAGVDTVIVCGETTSGCVRASAVDAYSNGFHVVLVEECCFDRSALSHKVNLFDLHQKYADVMHLEEVERRLRALPKSG